MAEQVMAQQHTPGLPDAWLHDGEWARVGGFYIYPRDSGEYSIGRPSGAREYCDVEAGFANMQAAIDHARWMDDELRAAIAAALAKAKGGAS